LEYFSISIPKERLSVYFSRTSEISKSGKSQRKDAVKAKNNSLIG
jgi:hypothetical protein